MLCPGCGAPSGANRSRCASCGARLDDGGAPERSLESQERRRRAPAAPPEKRLGPSDPWADGPPLPSGRRRRPAAPKRAPSVTERDAVAPRSPPPARPPSVTEPFAAPPEPPPGRAPASPRRVPLPSVADLDLRWTSEAADAGGDESALGSATLLELSPPERLPDPSEPDDPDPPTQTQGLFPSRGASATSELDYGTIQDPLTAKSWGDLAREVAPPRGRGRADSGTARGRADSLSGETLSGLGRAPVAAPAGSTSDDGLGSGEGGHVTGRRDAEEVLGPRHEDVTATGDHPLSGARRSGGGRTLDPDLTLEREADGFEAPDPSTDVRGRGGSPPAVERSISRPTDLLDLEAQAVDTEAASPRAPTASGSATSPAGLDEVGETHILSPEESRRLATGRPLPTREEPDLETLVRPLEPQSEPSMEAQPVAFAPSEPEDEPSLLGLLVEPEIGDGLRSAPEDEPPPDFTVAAPGELAGFSEADVLDGPAAEVSPEDFADVRRGLEAPVPPVRSASREPVSLEIDIDHDEPSLRRMTPRPGPELTDSGFEAYEDGQLSMPGDVVAPLDANDGWLHPALEAAPSDEDEEVEDTRALPPVVIPAETRIRVAPLWRRLGGVLVDLGVGLAAAAGLHALRPEASELFAAGWAPETLLDAVLTGRLGFDLAVGAFVGFGIAHALNASLGRSLGKLLFGLELVRAEGSPMGVGRGLARALLALPGLALLGAGCAWVLVDRRCRAWHDLLAGTLVVRRS